MTKPYLGNAPWYRQRDDAIVKRVTDGVHPHIVAQDVGMSTTHIGAILRARGWKYDYGRREWVKGCG